MDREAPAELAAVHTGPAWAVQAQLGLICIGPSGNADLLLVSQSAWPVRRSRVRFATDYADELRVDPG